MATDLKGALRRPCDEEDKRGGRPDGSSSRPTALDGAAGQGAGAVGTCARSWRQVGGEGPRWGPPPSFLPSEDTCRTALPASALRRGGAP